MRRWRLGLVTGLLLIHAGCTHGPETEKKSPLNYLNGDHYQANNFISGIPTRIDRQVVSTKITGHAQLTGDLVPTPAKYRPLALVRGILFFKARFPIGPMPSGVPTRSTRAKPDLMLATMK